MKIRRTDIKKLPSSTPSGSRVASSGFRVLLQDEIDTVSNVSASQEQDDAHAARQKQPWPLLEDALHLLDDMIGQIETHGKPDPASVRSLQHLRAQLMNQGQTTTVQQDINTVIAVESERLKSW